MTLGLTISGESAALAASANRWLETPETVAERSAGTGQTILVVGVPAILMFAVLAFGSFDPWAIDIVEASCALLGFLWIWPQMSSGALQLRRNDLYAPIFVFGLIIAAQIVFRSSAYEHATREELWKYVAYGILFLLASQCQGKSAQRLLTILAVFGFAVALFALVQDLTYNGKIYWILPAPSGFGPYANYSHYAGLMEMLTPIPLTLALSYDSRRRPQQLFWMAAGVLMAATIFVCGSRGGMIAFSTQALFLAGFMLMRRSQRTACILAALCLLTAWLAFWIDDGRMMAKINSLRDLAVNGATRLAIDKDSLRMVRDRPVVGWGLGLFPIVYPQYRSFPTDVVVNQAHNDYLQALVETGVLGFACVVWFIVNLYRSAIHTLRASSISSIARILGPLVGCTGILVHSFSDFNLHIPANAALFFVLCGIASAPVGHARATPIA